MLPCHKQESPLSREIKVHEFSFKTLKWLTTRAPIKGANWSTVCWWDVSTEFSSFARIFLHVFKLFLNGLFNMIVHLKRELFLLKESVLSLKDYVRVIKNMCKKYIFMYLDNFSSSNRSLINQSLEGTFVLLNFWNKLISLKYFFLYTLLYKYSLIFYSFYKFFPQNHCGNQPTIHASETLYIIRRSKLIRTMWIRCHETSNTTPLTWNVREKAR